MTLVRAEGLTYRTGGATLVSGLDLDVAAGELVAVLGPSGAGKSTLLSLLAGDLRPTSGRLLVDGDPPWDLHPLQLALRRSFLPQHIPADVPFTAGAVVAMGRHPHQVAGSTDPNRDRAAAAAAVAATDISHLLHLPVAVLSGGEQTRVALARVLAQETRLVLLDEPTTALDIGHQERVMRALAAVVAEGRGIVAAFHDINLAASHADRIVLMDGGRVRAVGPPAEVLDAALLEAVYRQRMRITEHPTRNRPLVIAVD